MCRVCILPRVQRFNLQTQIITSSRHTPIYTPTLNRLTHTHTSNAEVDRNLVDRCCIPIHAKAIQCHCQLHTQRSLSPTAAWELGKAAVVSDQVADDIEFGSRDPYLPLEIVLCGQVEKPVETRRGLGLGLPLVPKPEARELQQKRSTCFCKATQQPGITHVLEIASAQWAVGAE